MFTGKLKRTAAAMKAALAGALALVLFSAGAEARPAVGDDQGRVEIVISKSEQRMMVYVGGEQVYVFRVSTGRAGYVTPSGTFRPSSMHKMAISVKYGNTPMPHSIFFTRVGHAIHATTAVRQLGRPASHGCIRLSPQNAKMLYELVQRMGMKNTRIKIV